MNFFTAFSAVEEILLDVVANGEQSTTRRVSGCVFAVGACNTFGDGSYVKNPGEHE